MSENELNSYRFLSGEDPTDDQLECLMKGMGREAVDRRKSVEERMRNEMQQQWEILDAEWKIRINSQKDV